MVQLGMLAFGAAVAGLVQGTSGFAVLQNFNLIALSAAFGSLVRPGRVRPEMLPQMAVVAAALVVPSVWGSLLAPA